MQSKARSCSFSSGCVKKIFSPQMMGVELPRLGSEAFHAIFSVALHFTGKFFSLLMPTPVAPRHMGQFSACCEKVIAKVISRNLMREA